MNFHLAKEVGFFRYVFRKIWWKVAPPANMELPTGVMFPTPRDKYFASDVFVTEGNVDWNAEYILAAFLQSQAGKGDFLDVGAHIGYYSCLLRPFSRSVWAFEPDARNHPYLERAFKGLSNAHIVPKAVSDSDGEIAFDDQDESSISHIDFNGTKLVATTRLDTFVAENSLEPRAVKIDIEGFDILALRGATETARTHQPVFVVEYNQEENRPNTWAALKEFVDSVNYTIYAVALHKNGLKYTFSGYDINELAELRTKMLFVVPEKNREWFELLVRNYPAWTNKALRPDAVRSFLAAFAR